MRISIVLFALVAAATGLAQAPQFDLNTASADELETIDGIGATTAARIVRVRERNGPYRCVEELWAAPRLTQAQVRALSERTFVEDPDPRCVQQEEARRAGRKVEP